MPHLEHAFVRRNLGDCDATGIITMASGMVAHQRQTACRALLNLYNLRPEAIVKSNE